MYLNPRLSYGTSSVVPYEVPSIVFFNSKVGASALESKSCCEQDNGFSRKMTLCFFLFCKLFLYLTPLPDFSGILIVS